MPRRRAPGRSRRASGRRVVLPVPGFPENTRCRLPSNTGRPRSARSCWTRVRSATSFTSALTLSSPISPSSSARTSSSGRAGGRGSSSVAAQSVPPSRRPSEPPMMGLAPDRPCHRAGDDRSARAAVHGSARWWRARSASCVGRGWRRRRRWPGRGRSTGSPGGCRRARRRRRGSRRGPRSIEEAPLTGDEPGGANVGRQRPHELSAEPGAEGADEREQFVVGVEAVAVDEAGSQVYASTWTSLRSCGPSTPRTVAASDSTRGPSASQNAVTASSRGSRRATEGVCRTHRSPRSPPLATTPPVELGVPPDPPRLRP